MSKITYADKVTLNENPNVADVNKVKASDMNEIKQVVNANDNEIANLKGKILYENPSGSSSSFSLSEDWKNFKEIEVYFLSAGWLCNSSKMDCNSQTSLVLTTPYGAGTTSIAILSVVIQFSGTTASFIRPRTTTFDSGSANVPTITASADIKVTKVIGYR